MKCEKCGRYHRDFVPCEAVQRLAELRQRCDFCPDARWPQLRRLDGHPEERDNSVNGYSEGRAVAQCPECGAVWIMRYQYDDGMGSDNAAWVHELGPEVD